MGDGGLDDMMANKSQRQERILSNKSACLVYMLPKCRWRCSEKTPPEIDPNHPLSIHLSIQCGAKPPKLLIHRVAVA